MSKLNTHHCERCGRSYQSCPEDSLITGMLRLKDRAAAERITALEKERDHWKIMYENAEQQHQDWKRLAQGSASEVKDD